MARKHSPDHQRYQPVDEAFIRSVPFALGTSQTVPQNLKEQPAPVAPPQSPVSRPPAPVRALSTPRMEDLEESIEEQQESQASPVPERLDKPLKFRLPRSERTDVMRIVSRLGDQLQTSVEWSHVGRALVVLLRHAESEIIRQARRNGPLTRPANDQAIALADFEQRIAQILLRAFRDVSPPR
jgi:hypothetical protein